MIEYKASGIHLSTQTIVLAETVWSNYFRILGFIQGLKIPGERLAGKLRLISYFIMIAATQVLFPSPMAGSYAWIPPDEQ